MTKLLQDYVTREYTYDPETGVLSRAGKVLSARCSQGYRYVKPTINGKQYWIYQHRIAWFLHHGTWLPTKVQLDHIDCDKSNNVISNLRLATATQNKRNRPKSKNNTSGYKGVAWHKHSKSWQASIAGKHIGLYNTKLEAADAYDSKAIELFGAFAKLNAHQ